MPPRHNLTGKSFGRLTVVCLASTNRYGWECLCICGSKTVVITASLRNGHTRSCGCLQREAVTKHGFKGTPTWNSWRNMRSRCRDPHHISYSSYGGRGIKVCDRWNSFENFLADMGERPTGKSIDRIDNNGNYEPGNCMWSTPGEQINKQRRRTRKTKGD